MTARLFLLFRASFIFWVSLLALVLPSLSWVYGQQEGSAPATALAAPRVWLDPDGNPTPFASDEELLEFLRTARPVRIREIPQGVTRPRKVLLEKDGIRMHAKFLDVDEEKTIITFASGTTEIGFRDSYLFEAAAYQLSRLLGLDNVPPTTLRRIQGKSGSIQVWIENVTTETYRQKKKIEPPELDRWNRQMYIMWIFDALVQNTDRNLGNVLIDPNWKVWMIDHTRAFRRLEELENLPRMARCERTLWEKLQTLDEPTAREQLKPFLRAAEIDALLARRQKLVEHFQKLIEEKGEEQVLYTLP